MSLFQSRLLAHHLFEGGIGDILRKTVLGHIAERGRHFYFVTHLHLQLATIAGDNGLVFEGNDTLNTISQIEY